MTPDKSPEFSTQLASYLFSRRESLINAWHLRCGEDASLPSLKNLTHEEFVDMVPVLLNILEQRLRGVSEEADACQKAGEHGLHRWHKGYSLSAVLIEMAHLQTSISIEVENYLRLYPDIPIASLHQVYMTSQTFFNEIVRGSIEKFDELQRSSAIERVANLQRVMQELNELRRQQGEYLRTASHDLRGSLGVISGATSLLEQPDSPEELREQMAGIVQRNMAIVRALLNELMDLSHLEAGHETLTLGQFDATELIQEVVREVQPLAQQRGLTLQADGPESLLVEGDAAKVRRIAENLLHNALRHTPAAPDRPGWVSITWMPDNEARWRLSVQDGSPTLPPGTAAWLAEALKPTHDTAGVIYSTEQEPVPPNPGLPPSESTGESIGLFVVKRLCELLEASLDVEVRAAHDGVLSSTIFRVRFPARYADDSSGK